MAKKLLMSNLLTPPIDERIFAEYTFDNTIDSNCLPHTLTIEGGYEVIDEVNGNITRRILRNTDKNKPTVIRFANKKALLTVDNLIAQPTHLDSLFYECSNLTNVNLLRLDTSKVTNIRHTFSGCSKLISLDLSNFDTSNITNIQNMFENCSSLTSLDLSNFNTSKVTFMYKMFYGCSKLTNLDISNFNTSKVTSMGDMFYDCAKLISLDLSGFDTSGVKNIRAMFFYCRTLSSEILISNPNITSYSDMFNYTSTNPDAKFTVRYTNEATKAMAEKLVATKSTYSNVVLADAPGL